MSKISTFKRKWKSDGLSGAISATLYDLFGLDITNAKNAVRFRSPRILFSCDIDQVLPKSTKLGHPVGIVVVGDAEIGENVQINQNVTIGVRGGKRQRGVPKIEDNVRIYSGAVVLGDITLEQGVQLVLIRWFWKAWKKEKLQ